MQNFPLTKLSLFQLLLLFFAFQIFLYGFMFVFRSSIPFHSGHYRDYHNKYFGKAERQEIPSSFLENLSVYDSQWYLTLAEHGYAKPTKAEIDNPANNSRVLAYVFFPLYPILLSIGNAVIKNIETTAFVLSFLLQTANAASLYLVGSKLFSKHIAIKSSILLFVFPFGIFFRSYYSENLFLLLLIWFSYFAHTKKYVLASIPLGLLLVTRGAGMLLLPYFLFLLLRDWNQKVMSLRATNKSARPVVVLTKWEQSLRYIVSLMFACLPLLAWIVFVYVQTGNPLLFLTIKQYWLQTSFPLLRILYTFSIFPFLPFHDFHASKVDITIIIITGILVWKSKKTLPPVLWWISFCLWITPLLTHDTMSFSRYQVVNFPLFLYLAHVLEGKKYWGIAGIFAALLMIVSILFLNFYWIG